jgi:hypothetical protein
MPIDDVDYMLENCVTDNHIIYVDSARRDMSIYPRANHYTLRFSTPYRYVHGIEVLDASIPSTMFNIDTHNNVLSYLSADEDMTPLLQELVTLPCFSKILSFSLNNHIVQEQRLYGTSVPFKIVLVEEDVSKDDVFGDPIALSEFIDDCLDVDVDALNKKDDPFDGFSSGSGAALDPTKTSYLVIKKHTMPTVNLYSSKAAAYFGDLPIYEVVIDGDTMYTTDAYFYDFYASYAKKYGDQCFYDIMRLRNPKVARAYKLQRRSCEEDVYIWNYYTITSESKADFESVSSASKSPPLTVWQTVFKPGNYSAVSFLKLSEQYMSGDVVLDLGGLDTIETYPNYKLIGRTPFAINKLGTSIGSVIGISEVATSQWPLNYKYIPEVPYLYGSLDNNSDNTLECPGIVDFTANRYVILRCEEIEDHMYGSYSYGDFTPGIAMLRFFEVNGVSHQRNDYVNYVKPPFHPIGKLDKITLTFLLPDLTTIYDFKGLDHVMLLSVKFYAPKQMRKMQMSVLNPNYNPNFHEYMHQHIDYKRKSELLAGSTSITQAQDVADTNAIREIEKRFDYSSSEDEDITEDPHGDSNVLSDFET